MTIPYERFIQWIAGPVAILCGYLATQLSQHVQFLGSAGIHRDSIAIAIYKSVVFLAGTGATYAAHHKWLTNLPKWWSQQNLATMDPIFGANVGTGSEGTIEWQQTGSNLSQGIPADELHYGLSPEPEGSVPPPPDPDEPVSEPANQTDGTPTP